MTEKPKVRRSKAMKLRRPHLKLMYVLVPDEVLQSPYQMLWLLKHDDPQAKMVKDAYFSLIEVLVEEYSPPFAGGKEWDNRRKGLCK